MQQESYHTKWKLNKSKKSNYLITQAWNPLSSSKKFKNVHAIQVTSLREYQNHNTKMVSTRKYFLVKRNDHLCMCDDGPSNNDIEAWLALELVAPARHISVGYCFFGGGSPPACRFPRFLLFEKETRSISLRNQKNCVVRNSETNHK